MQSVLELLKKDLRIDFFFFRLEGLRGIGEAGIAKGKNRQKS